VTFSTAISQALAHAFAAAKLTDGIGRLPSFANGLQQGIGFQ
jgi:hypothetical protein